MRTPLSKTQLLAELNHENTSWQVLLDDIGEANMTQTEVAGGWSIKDIVAHLTELATPDSKTIPGRSESRTRQCTATLAVRVARC